MEDRNPYSPPAVESVWTPQRHETELASRWARLGGSFLDGIMVLLFTLPLLFLFGFFENFPDEPLSLGDQLFIGVLGLGIWFALNAYALAKRSQTLGKIVVGTRIVRSDGGHASFGRIVWLRYVAMQFLGMVPFVLIVDALMIFGSSRRCLHDHLADTIVVNVAP